MTTSRKFATSPDVLVAKGKIKSQMRLYWSQFRALISMLYIIINALHNYKAHARDVLSVI